MTLATQTTRFRSPSEIIRLASQAPEWWIEPDAYLRYHPIIHWIQKHARSNSQILEAGSGDFGLSAYTSFPIAKIDLTFRRKQSNDFKIAASADSLPFRDSEFDLTFAVDLLEHVPVLKRLAIISELVRTSKHSICIVFPCGEQARKSDLVIADHWHKFTRKPLSILETHRNFSFPTQMDIAHWISQLHKAGLKTMLTRSFNLHYREWLMLGWLKQKKYARFLAERIIRNSFFRTLINYGNCYRQILWIEKVGSAHSNRLTRSHSIPAHVLPL